MTILAPAIHAASIHEAFRTTMMSKNLAPQKLVSQTTRNASYLLHLEVSNSEIAWHLGISPRTAEKHITSLLRAHGHSSRTQFIASRIPNSLPSLTIKSH